jgi:hypothetical protein
MCANTASFAIKEISNKIALFVLINAAFRAEYLAHTALNTLIEIISRLL